MIIHDGEKLFNLIAYLVAYLVALRKGVISQEGIDDVEHELDKDGTARVLVGLFKGLVVAGLLIFDQAFDGEEVEQVVPLAEDEGLPESAHATIAIDEGMDEFEFVVKDAAFDQGVVFGDFEPIYQIAHKEWDSFCGWGDVGDLGFFVNADAAFAKFSGVGEDICHQGLVGGEQMFEGGRIPGGEGFVGSDCALDFGDFSGWAENFLAVENGGDLIEGEGVAFDSEGALDGADAVLFAELGGDVEILTIEPPDLL